MPLEVHKPFMKPLDLQFLKGDTRPCICGSLKMTLLLSGLKQSEMSGSTQSLVNTDFQSVFASVTADKTSKIMKSSTAKTRTLEVTVKNQGPRYKHETVVLGTRLQITA